MTNRNFSRRAFLESTTALAAAPMVMKGVARKRNVLFISSDDLCNRIGCYGNRIVRTPNIDRLARSGVRFDRAYCQFPLCGPSRSSLMTGLAPDTTRVWGNAVQFRSVLPDVVTLPQAFQKNGYFTARAGKIYHYNNPSEIGTPGLDDPASWHETVNPAGDDRTKDEVDVTFLAGSRPASAASGATGGSGRSGSGRGPAGSSGPGVSGVRIAQDGKTPVLPMPNGDLGISIAYNRSASRDETQTEFLVADAVIAMMEQHRNEPWFLGAGFFKPHVPWIVPSKYFDLYKLDQIDVPPFDESELTIAPHWAYTMTTPNYGMNNRNHREAIRAYYAATSFMDAQIGRLLDAVGRLGLRNDTTTVLWSDHGWQLGEHGQWQKQTLFEPSARVPLIMAGAGVKSAGKSCARTVEHLDIYPTLVDLCGLQGAPSGLHGRSLMPLVANPDARWDRPAITQVSRGNQANGVMGYSMRTERYRYTFWKQGTEGEELYDYLTDPRELRNLARESASTAVKTNLRNALESICRSRGMQNAPGALATA